MFKVTSTAPADFIWPAHNNLVLKQGVNHFPALPDELVKRFRIMQEDKQVVFESSVKILADERWGLPEVDATDTSAPEAEKPQQHNQNHNQNGQKR